MGGERQERGMIYGPKTEAILAAVRCPPQSSPVDAHLAHRLSSESVRSALDKLA